MREIKLRFFDTSKAIMFTSDDVSSYEVWDCVQDKRFKSMQFTGLQDINKKDIYEGDIVRHQEGSICEVIFSKKAAKFCIRRPSKQWHGTVNKIYSVAGVEVIGNIHENPELLK